MGRKNKYIPAICFLATAVMSLFVYMFKVPNPNVILLTVIVYFTFIGGFISGFISGIIVVLYSLFFFSLPGQLFVYTRENFEKIIVIIMFVPIMILIVGNLKKQVEIKTRELVMANEKLEKMSKLDALTGIPNRGYFDIVFFEEYKLSKRMKTPLSMAMIDIDYFKRYNDEYGHLSGDECLKNVAQAINSEVQRESDFLARYGGEEFVVIFPNTDIEAAMIVCEKVSAAIKALNIPHKDSPISAILTVSIGLASISIFEGFNYIELLKKADEELYLAKEKGRNRLESILIN